MGYHDGQPKDGRIMKPPERDAENNRHNTWDDK